ncbi:unnamed protein product [Acanthosepion pharaonis]|uniref:FAS1 domain-containing protein n=1 Tax=Acanthosepion pharaonis TaxID=158019 RepID=A0A812C482_ACAPH|nr:unnamed protein product [Sepia pharaonis]
MPFLFFSAISSLTQIPFLLVFVSLLNFVSLSDSFSEDSIIKVTFTSEPSLEASINEAAVVLPDMFNHNSTDTYFTAFSPNDSFLNSMPNYGKDRLFGNWTFLQNVFKAHIILGDVYFLPTHGQLQPLVPLEGTLTFTRDGDKIIPIRTISSSLPRHHPNSALERFHHLL